MGRSVGDVAEARLERLISTALTIRELAYWDYKRRTDLDEGAITKAASDRLARAAKLREKWIKQRAQGGAR